jgi:hypothetical protein
MDSFASQKVTTTEGGKKLKCVPWFATLQVMGCVGAPGLRILTSKSITHIDLHKLNNKLVSAWLEHFWCMNEPRANTNS